MLSLLFRIGPAISLKLSLNQMGSGVSSHPWELAWREGRWYEASSAFPAVVEFAKYLEKTGAKTILDFGSGAGRHTIYLAKEGFRVIAFDISLSALKQLSERVKMEKLDIVFLSQNEMSKLPFADGAFDAVIGNNVLHHSTTHGISASLSEVFRVMRMGGAGYFSILSRNDYKYGTGTPVESATYVSTEPDEAGIIHHFFSEDELRLCFSKFDIISLDEELIPIEKGYRGHYHLRFRKGSRDSV